MTVLRRTPSGKYEDLCPACGAALSADEVVRAGMYLQTEKVRIHVRVCQACGRGMFEKFGLVVPPELAEVAAR